VNTRKFRVIVEEAIAQYFDGDDAETELVDIRRVEGNGLRVTLP